MKNRMIKVGCAVPAVSVGNVPANVATIRKIALTQKDLGVLVFPELSLTGYTCGDLFFEETLLEEARKGVLSLAKVTESLPGMTLVVGLPLAYKNALYNVAAFLSEGHIVGFVPKSAIPNYGEFYERRWFSSGRDIHDEKVNIDGVDIPFSRNLLFKDSRSDAIIGTDICEDLWVPDKPSTHACLQGANIIVNLSASDEVIRKKEYRRNLVTMQSGSCYCAYLYCSAGTRESSTDLVFSGHCLIANNGNLLQECIYPKENQVLTAVINLSENSYNRRHQSTFAAAASESDAIMLPVAVQPLGGKTETSVDALTSLLKKESYPVSRTPFVPATDSDRKERSQDILAIQASGLATRVKNTGILTLVLGVSGGLDSTLALLVAVEAKKQIPAIRIIPVTMPQEGNTSSLTYQNSLNLIKALDLKPRIIPIGASVQQHLKDIGHSGTYEGKDDTTYENAQARMRTYLLMDIANQEKGMVVGTGDLSELTLGWCTYNGDHMSMYGVNASVPKTLVRYIVQAYAETKAKPFLATVLESIVATPITPELTPMVNGTIIQKTEERIGKYDLNDFFLFYHLRYGATPEMILTLALVAYPELSKAEGKEALSHFYSRFYSQAFKRSCLPDGPKVGSVTLSPRGDYRMPSDVKPEMLLDALKKA